VSNEPNRLPAFIAAAIVAFAVTTWLFLRWAGARRKDYSR